MAGGAHGGMAGLAGLDQANHEGVRQNVVIMHQRHTVLFHGPGCGGILHEAEAGQQGDLVGKRDGGGDGGVDGDLVDELFGVQHDQLPAFLHLRGKQRRQQAEDGEESVKARRDHKSLIFSRL